MSDARPITNITDYVCGSCWNSFSRADPGVVQGDRLVCPHCGHMLPQEVAGADVASAVRSAPAARLEDSDAFGAGISAVATPASGTLAPDQGFPELDAASPYGWVPPEVVVPGATKRDSGGGFIVGEPDEFDFNEPTLRPDQSQSELLAMVRAAPPRPASDSGTPFVAGDELGADVDEKTPVDGAAALNPAPGVSKSSAAASGPDDGPGFGGEEPGDGEADYEHRDWKLKAMGLTYNFHGLDALVNWASNKAGQTMSVSSDGGVTWKDFHSFFEGVKEGLSAQKAFEAALEPGAAPPPSGAGTRALRATMTAKNTAAVPDLQLPKPEGESPVLPAAPEPAPAVAPGQGGSAAAISRSMPTVGAHRSVAPSSSPSRRTPIASRQPAEKETRNGAKIAVAVVFIALLVAALLHVQGVLKIPGLH